MYRALGERGRMSVLRMGGSAREPGETYGYGVKAVGAGGTFPAWRLYASGDEAGVARLHSAT